MWLTPAELGADPQAAISESSRPRLEPDPVSVHPVVSITPSRSQVRRHGFAARPGAHREEKRAIPAHSTAAGPTVGTGRGAGLRLAVLPEFVTPDWLRENYHLMKADLRKLADAIGKDYPDWPATADGNDEAAFYRAVHDFAGRWTWFPWLFEERILTLFGRVKGKRKRLGPRVLKATAERARALRGGSPDGGEATILDDLDTLCEAGEYNRAAQSVWVLSCLEGPERVKLWRARRAGSWSRPGCRSWRSGAWSGIPSIAPACIPPAPI